MSTPVTSRTRVAFATHAYERDWRIVLLPERFRLILESHQFQFSDRVVILNNFTKNKKKALSAAERLLKLNLATTVLEAPEYLSDGKLLDFGLEPDFFWSHNPFFTTAQLAALHFLQGRADYLVHMSGDVWLQQACNWIPGAVEAMREDPRIRGINLCRNIYRHGYPHWAHSETDKLWISHGKETTLMANDKRRGWGVSDHAYLIQVSPRSQWNFSLSHEDIEKLGEYWPPYARPCFEMYYTGSMIREDWWHAALKPAPGLAPVTKHKSFPRSTAKLLIYKMLGYYRKGGRFATH